MFKVIWVAGMPRSGSMWTFNVVRALARHAGYRVLPDNVLLSDGQWVDYANREIAANKDPQTVFVMKMHSLLHTIMPNNLVITNIRDIRDALLSHMRFMHVDFERALKMSKAAANTADHYISFPEEARMVLRYDVLTEAPAAAVARIAERMGVALDDKAAEDIAASLSKEKVKRLTDAQDQHYRASVTNQQPFAGELLKRADGVPATFDRSTGFQSNHVSDYRDGAWRDQLSRDQITAMHDVFGPWLQRNGFGA